MTNVNHVSKLICLCYKITDDNNTFWNHSAHVAQVIATRNHLVTVSSLTEHSLVQRWFSQPWGWHTKRGQWFEIDRDFQKKKKKFDSVNIKKMNKKQIWNV